MTRANMPTENLKDVHMKVYDPCSFEVSNVRIEAEGIEYDACQFQLNGLKIICRSAKITPKKNGQFVTFWKRNKRGITEPYSETDTLDFYVINVRSKERFGQFVFPKSELINKGILRTEKRDGKRGFRVYPAWDSAQSKQASATQKWQVNYFFEIGTATDFKKVIKLYGQK